MNTEIVAITQPLVKTEDGSRWLSANEFVAYTARISNPGNQLNTETAPKLIKYLAKNKHWSPFQMVSLAIRITTTRDISHQIIRHWSFDDAGNANIQEFSQRYAPVENFETRECRLQDSKNRQNSTETDDLELKLWWESEQGQIIYHAREIYNLALTKGIAKEQARAVLPEGLTQTTFFMAGTLRAWIHYLQARCAEGVQKEHRQIANKCKELVLEHFPDIKLLFESE